MSGSDTSRGINFQYACAISILLDLVENVSWEMIQLEGKEDIEDILIYGKDNRVIERIQIKQKRDPHQWKPSEFRDIILFFAGLKDDEAVLYRVVYSGSEGPEFYNHLKPSLLKIQIDGWESLSQLELNRLNRLLGNDNTACRFLEKTQHRFRIEKHDSWASKRIRDLERIRAFFRDRSVSEASVEWDANIYSKLFEVIAVKNEGESNYLRQVTRSDFYELLGLEIPISWDRNLNWQKYYGWLRQNAMLYSDLISLLVEEEPSYPDFMKMVIQVHSESDKSATQKHLSPLDVLEKFSHVLLCGESGSGKTTCLWQIALSNLTGNNDKRKPLLPVYIDLSGYDGEHINELIRNSIASSGQQISNELMADLSARGNFVLLLDDYDSCRSSLKQDLQLRLKSWIRNNDANKVVIISHNASDGGNLDLPTYKILSLLPEQRSEILSSIRGISKRDIANIQHGRPLESDHFIKNPLLLKMLAYYYMQSNNSIPKSRSPLYQKAVDGIMILSERKGHSEFGKDLKVKLLALIAAWMQNNNIHSLAPSTISNLLYEWSNENSLVSPQLLRDLNHPRLIAELLHSGLFRFQLNGNIQFIHSTFRSFLAAQVINEDSLRDLVANSNWYSSILFWASQVDLEKSNLVFKALNDDYSLLGQLINERAVARAETDADDKDWAVYFEEFCICFVRLVSNFPILLSYKPWDKLLEWGLELLICQVGDDIMIYFHPGQTKGFSAKVVDFIEIEKLQQEAPETVPLSLSLFPKKIVATHHPLELSYIWILRALFDSLYFFGQEGGLDISKASLEHPAFGLLLNRFVLFQTLSSNLPPFIQDKLPFYATKPFSLVMELHIYTDAPFIRYAVVETTRPTSIAVIPLMYSDIKEVKHLINLNRDGTADVTLEKRTFISTLAHDLDLGDLYASSAGAVAQSWLRDYLRKNLVGFPPIEW